MPAPGELIAYHRISFQRRAARGAVMTRKDLSLKLLQISDTHLHAAADSRMRGVTTYSTFRAVIEQAQRDRRWPVDAILATGDIVQDESRAGYERFRASLEPLGVPVYSIPGNHDDPAARLPDALTDALERAMREMNSSGIWRSPKSRGVGANPCEAIVSSRNEPMERWQRHTLSSIARRGSRSPRRSVSGRCGPRVGGGGRTDRSWRRPWRSRARVGSGSC